MVLIPIRDEAEYSLLRPPVILLSLILVNVLVFLWSFYFSFDTESFFQRFGLMPNDITGYKNLHTLITAIFLHMGWVHLIGNMWFLWLFGDNVEDAMGKIRFLVFYILIGVLAGLFYAVTASGKARFDIAVGASGAISGVLGGYVVIFPKNKIKLWTFILGEGIAFSVPIYVYAIGWFAFQYFYGMFPDSSNIGYATHIGGFAAGAILAKLFEKKIIRMDFSVADETVAQTRV